MRSGAWLKGRRGSRTSELCPRGRGVGDEGPDGRFEKVAVEGEPTKFAGEDFNLAAHVEFALEDESPPALDDTEATLPAFEVGPGDIDVEPHCERLEFLKQLFVGQVAAGKENE